MIGVSDNVEQRPPGLWARSGELKGSAAHPCVCVCVVASCIRALAAEPWELLEKGVAEWTRERGKRARLVRLLSASGLTSERV